MTEDDADSDISRRSLLHSAGLGGIATGLTIVSDSDLTYDICFPYLIYDIYLPYITNDIYFPYNSPSYEDKYTFVDSWGKRELASSPVGCGKSLSLDFVAGDYEGCSLKYDFERETGSQPDEAWLQYYIYVPTDFDVGGGLKYGVGWLNEDNGAASGGVSDGLPDGRAFSVRPSMDPGGSNDAVLKNYTYHGHQDGQYGDGFYYNEHGEINFGQWYRIDQHIKMNAPGQHSGQQHAWVDGNLALSKENLKYRGSNYSFGIGDVWHNCWWGGNDPSPADQSAYFERLYVSTYGPIDNSLEPV